MANTSNSGAFKKMSQRAMWRGDSGQSQMLANHGMEGLRHNLLRDTPTYKKDAVGLNQNGANFFKNSKTASSGNTNTNNSNSAGRNTNTNTKVKQSTSAANQNTKKSLGASILNSL